MAPDKWTIPKEKKVLTPMASERQARKRVRLSGATSEEGQKQQTLTQAQWVPSRPPSFKDEPDLKPLRLRSGRRTSKGQVKQNSTLTQMDFFTDAHKQEELDDLLLTEIGATAKSPRRRDGDDDSTKSRCQGKPAKAAARASQKSTGDGLEDLEPAKKRRRDGDVTPGPEPNVRRRSGRLIDREYKKIELSATPRNTVFGEGFHIPSEQPESGKYEVLEIQDSTGTNLDDVELADQPRPSLQTPVPPKTPPNTTRSVVVLSSQSPEREECLSLIRSGRNSVVCKTPQVQYEGYMRSPLREKSVNLLSQPRICDKLGKTIPRLRKASTPTPSLSKIVSLKLPKRSIMQAHRSKVEDSQALWSLPTSSSSVSSQERLRAMPNSSTGQDCFPPPVEAAEAGSGESDGTAEIPCTSDAGEEEATTFAGDKGVEQHPDQELGGQHTEQLPEVAVEDETSCTKTPSPSPVTPGKQHESQEDSDLYFDSPIANDTQFNAEVARRTATSSSLDPEKILPEDSFVVPTPRLVSSTSRRLTSHVDGQRQQDQGPKQSTSEDLLPQAPQAGTTMTTTRPLNDTLMAPPPLPPSLPPSSSLSSQQPTQSNSHRIRSITTTQRSTAAEIRPASMPHLSQISTQEATQFGLMSSLVPPDESPNSRDKKEPITIKEDSSSLGLLSLSQIPMADRESQAMDVGVIGIEDGAEEEEEEIDLDECLYEQDVEEQGHYGTNKLVTIKKDVDDDNATRRTKIKQESESQVDTNPVGEQGEAEEEPQALLLSSPSPSHPVNNDHGEDDSGNNNDHSPIPGFDNETQSNFTQGGHVTAAYIHRQRNLGILPKWYTPKPYRVPGYTRR